MNEKLNLILENQRLIMKALRGSFNYDELKFAENKIFIELNPTQKQSLPNKTNEALSEGCGKFLHGTTSCGDYYIKTHKKEFCKECETKFAKRGK